MPGTGSAMRRASRVARGAGYALIQVFTAPDPVPPRPPRPSWPRRATRAGLVLATVLCALVSLFGLIGLNWLPDGVTFAAVAPTDGRRVVADQRTWFVLTRFPSILRPGLIALGGPALWSVLVVLIALAVVVPLAVAARYPLLGWRIAWAGLLLVPLTGMRWTAGGPWDPVQVPLLLVTFCVAGVRHPRPLLWWMWALSLIPWWLYAGHELRGPAVGVLGTLAFTAVAVAVDAVGARRRVVAAHAEQAEFEQGRRAVLTERARVARELHDVVAHHLSLIAVRADAAPYRLAGLARRSTRGVRRPRRDRPRGHDRGARAARSAAHRPARRARPAAAIRRPARTGRRRPRRRAGRRTHPARTAQRAARGSGQLRVPDRPGVAVQRGTARPGAAVSVGVEVEPCIVRLKISNGPPESGAQQRHGGQRPRSRPGRHAGAGHAARRRVPAGPTAGGGFAVAAELPTGERRA